VALIVGFENDECPAAMLAPHAGLRSSMPTTRVADVDISYRLTGDGPSTYLERRGGSGSGHLIHLEKPDLTMAKVDELLPAAA
jgi:hypothetical protein